jgi:PmbA protein
MLDKSVALDLAEALLGAARRHGADAADAVVHGSLAHGISVRLGKLEDVERSESSSAGLRVFCGQRSATIATSDFTPAGIDALAARAVAMARAAPEDSYAGLAPADALAAGPFPDLDLSDGLEPRPEDLRDLALETEDAARAIPGVTNSEGASASVAGGVVALATSNGFAGSYSGGSHSLGVSTIAGEGARMQRDHASRSARHRADMPPPAEVGRLAGERTVARLDPDTLPSGPTTVVFDPRVGASLVGHLIAAMSAPAIARRASFLVGKLGEQLFAPGVALVEDPLKPRGLRSRPFDGEGLATRRRAWIEDGRVTGWLSNVASARQLGIALTGNAARGTGVPGVGAANLDFAPGAQSRDELVADIREGVLITELIGQGVNLTTGDYSRGAAGFRIVGGEIAGPVSGFTIAGNLLQMFGTMRPANDIEGWRAVNVPSLRIEDMVVAGA